MEERKTRIEFKHEDNWQDVKDATMTTINKDGGKYPDSEWKRKLILSEHSPIRKMKFAWKWFNLKSWVSVHFVRHKFGIDHWVATQRTDRTGINRDELPQGSLVMHECEANAQSLINISRKRLCHCASKETREAWQMVKDEVAKTEPELASCMVRECVYRGFCPEMFSCGYAETDKYLEELAEYRGVSLHDVMSFSKYKENYNKKVVDNCLSCKNECTLGKDTDGDVLSLENTAKILGLDLATLAIRKPESDKEVTALISNRSDVVVEQDKVYFTKNPMFPNKIVGVYAEETEDGTFYRVRTIEDKDIK